MVGVRPIILIRFVGESSRAQKKARVAVFRKGVPVTCVAVLILLNLATTKRPPVPYLSPYLYSDSSQRVFRIIEVTVE